MGLGQCWLGSRIEAMVVDEAGHRRLQKLSPERIERLREQGYGVVRLDRVPVHLLDAVQRPCQTEWEAGKDVTRNVVERHADPEAGALYAVCRYEGLEPRESMAKVGSAPSGDLHGVDAGNFRVQVFEYPGAKG